MKGMKRHQNFILYILLISCIITILSVGFQEHTFSLASDKITSSISSQSFTTSDNITTIHVSEDNLALAIIKGIRNSSSKKTMLRNSILLIFVLTLLSGVFRLTQEIYGFYQRLYIKLRLYLIAYMHAKDGRKRLSPKLM